MAKSSAAERIQRVNAAIEAYRRYSCTSRVLTILMDRYKVSRRQAYRYLQEALKADRPQPVPERKIVFTVRLPESLVLQLRGFTQIVGKSLSDLVAEVLEDFLNTG